MSNYESTGTVRTDERYDPNDDLQVLVDDWSTATLDSTLELQSGIITLSQAYPDVDHRWTHSEGSGSTLGDSEGSLDGSTDASWVGDSNALDGYYLEYDGSSQYTSFGTDAFSFIYDSSYTFTAWINPSSLSDDRTIAGWHDGSYGWWFAIRSGELNVYHGGGSPGSHSAFPLSTDQWQFVAVRYDYDAQEVTLTLGDSHNTASLGTFTHPPNGAGSYFGRFHSGSPRLFHGGADAKTFTTRYLTDSDLEAIRSER